MKRARGIAGVIGTIILCSGLPVFGQGVPVTVNLTDFNGDPIVTIAGQQYYAGVYNGSTTLPTAPGLICDDFAGSVSPPQTWNALGYQASALTPTIVANNLLFGGAVSGFTNIGVHGYAALANLVNLSFNSAGNPALQGDISEAIWSITDPALLGSITANALSLRTAALLYATNTFDSFSQYTNLWIFVPNPLTASNLGTTQEMWGRVPEGGSALLYLLLGGGFCLGAVFLSFRNRLGVLKA